MSGNLSNATALHAPEINELQQIDHFRPHKYYVGHRSTKVIDLAEEMTLALQLRVFRRWGAFIDIDS